MPAERSVTIYHTDQYLCDAAGMGAEAAGWTPIVFSAAEMIIGNGWQRQALLVGADSMPQRRLAEVLIIQARRSNLPTAILADDPAHLRHLPRTPLDKFIAPRPYDHIALRVASWLGLVDTVSYA